MKIEKQLKEELEDLYNELKNRRYSLIESYYQTFNEIMDKESQLEGIRLFKEELLSKLKKQKLIHPAIKDGVAGHSYNTAINTVKEMLNNETKKL